MPLDTVLCFTKADAIYQGTKWGRDSTQKKVSVSAGKAVDGG